MDVYLMISPATRYKFELFRDDIAEWGELGSWALLGAAFGFIVLVGIGVLAWYGFWYLAVEYV